jgi:predicted alpha-1,2-mannosidase
MINKSLIFAAFILAVLLNSCQAKTEKVDFTQYVDPFIGTAGTGHCFPGACVPLGMIQASPETGNGAWEYCSGYQYKDSLIRGFSQTHLNGTGCPDLGDILMLPFAGNANRREYASSFSKDSETASPGYYRVILSDSEVKAELTASEHCAFHKYTYLKDNSPKLLIDFQSGLVRNLKDLHSHVIEASVNFENDYRISGFARTKEWLERTYFYVIEFDKPIAGKLKLEPASELEKAPRYIFDFDLKKGENLKVKVALSAKSVDNAKKNITSEIPDWDFDKVRIEAKALWNDRLSRIKIEGSSEKKRIFYTSMYHLFIQPNNIADAGEQSFYSTFSLWDTYRAAHPLYTIIAPEKVDDFINSMLRQYDEQGFLPIWALWGKETYTMIGNHAVPVIADAYLKGFKGFNVTKAFEAVKESLTRNHKKSDWNVYAKFGYYPFDIIKEESVSKTLEFTYDDYCAALFAKALGQSDDFKYFMNRSGFYQNLFDKQTCLMRGKDSAGCWRTPFHTSLLSAAGSIGGDYTEGNAWQYTWHIQHDVDGLIKLMGGSSNFTEKLDSLFAMKVATEKSGSVLDVSGLIGQYAHGNEPSHHVSYLYTLAGKPWRTHELVRQIIESQYSDAKNGLCGNEDCGQMSAWYIFSNLGFYPVNPCGGEFVLGAPQLKGATINLPGGKAFKIKTVNFSDGNRYVQSIKLNGNDYEKNTISYQNIIQGGELTFIMGSDPVL